MPFIQALSLPDIIKKGAVHKLYLRNRYRYILHKTQQQSAFVCSGKQ